MFYCKFCGFLVREKECRNCGAGYELYISHPPTKTKYEVQNEERVGYNEKGDRVKL